MRTEIVVNDFEQLYLAVRDKEGRMYTDAELKHLPEIDEGHQYYSEWQIRKRSANRFICWLQNKQRPLNVLEIGCGNGWLSAKIAGLPNVKMTALDINETEINQARRVFKKQNLRFVYDRFDEHTFGDLKFDIILFAASIAYFPDINDILQLALACLTPGGEIHLLDTHFYKPEELDSARDRCLNYYAGLGFPEMYNRYFHHTLNDIGRFNYKVLLDPRSLINRLGKKEPFYWISISK